MVLLTLLLVCWWVMISTNIKHLYIWVYLAHLTDVIQWA